MNQYFKNDLFKQLFSKMFDNFKMDYYNNDLKIESTSKNANIAFKELTTNLNLSLRSIYDHLYNENNCSVENNQTIKNEFNNTYNNKYINDLNLENSISALNEITIELKNILKDNFKIAENDNLNNVYNKRERRLSEAVLIDKDELIDKNKISPVINIEAEHSNQQENLKDKISSINNYVMRLKEITKIPENSSKNIFKIINLSQFRYI